MGSLDGLEGMIDATRRISKRDEARESMHSPAERGTSRPPSESGRGYMLIRFLSTHHGPINVRCVCASTLKVIRAPFGVSSLFSMTPLAWMFHVDDDHVAFIRVESVPVEESTNESKARTHTRTPSDQGLTLVHFAAQLERFVWDMGCAQGLCSPYQGGVRGC